MRVHNQMLTTLSRNRAVRQARMRASIQSRNRTSNNSNKLSRTSKNNTVWNSINNNSNNQSTSSLYTNYSSMYSASQNLLSTSEKLLNDEDDSLFEQALEEQVSKSNKTDAKEKVIDKIEKVVNNYNTMVQSMSTIGKTVNTLYKQQLNQYVSKSADQLKKIGITANSDGTLSIDEKSLEKADVKDLKNLFGEKNSFLSKVTVRTKNILSNAKSNLTLLSQYNYGSSYNRYGNSEYSSTNNIRGNYYNKRS